MLFSPLLKPRSTMSPSQPSTPLKSIDVIAKRTLLWCGAAAGVMALISQVLPYSWPVAAALLLLSGAGAAWGGISRRPLMSLPGAPIVCVSAMTGSLALLSMYLTGITVQVIGRVVDTLSNGGDGVQFPVPVWFVPSVFGMAAASIFWGVALVLSISRVAGDPSPDRAHVR